MVDDELHQLADLDFKSKKRPSPPVYHVERFELRSVAPGFTGAAQSPFDIQVDNPILHVNFPPKELIYNLSPWMTKSLPS